MDDLRSQLAASARLFYTRGWMLGTAGNLSARETDGSFWITASGRAKGSLSHEDFLRIGSDGAVVQRGREESRPSAEVSIHRALYDLFADVRAVFHVHTIESNLLTQLFGEGSVPLPGVEMLKGFGVFDENPEVKIDVFENHADVHLIAADLRERYAQHVPRIPGMLIRNHGLTVWAGDTVAALNYVELLDYCFRYILAARAARVPME